MALGTPKNLNARENVPESGLLKQLRGTAGIPPATEELQIDTAAAGADPMLKWLSLGAMCPRQKIGGMLCAPGKKSAMVVLLCNVSVSFCST